MYRATPPSNDPKEIVNYIVTSLGIVWDHIDFAAQGNYDAAV